MNLGIIFPKDSEALFNINSNRTFGGASVQLFNISKQISGINNINVISMIPNYKEINFDHESEFNFYKAYDEKDNLIVKFSKFYSAIQETKPSIILQRGLTAFSCILAVYLSIIGIKFVYMFAHDVETLGLYQNSRKKCRLFYLLLKFSSLLIVQNEIQHDNLRKILKYDSRVKILKKGIEVKPEIIKRKTRKYYSAAWIARCEPWKNIEAFIRLAKKNQGKNFLIITSPMSSKEDYFLNIKDQVLSIENIKFFDFLPNNKIYEVLSDSGMFCITSDSEGDWPMTVLEAAACGVPILSLNFDYGGLLEKYNAGFYCRGNEDLLNDFYHKIENDKDISMKCSISAKKYIEKFHDIRINSEVLINYLSSL